MLKSYLTRLYRGGARIRTLSVSVTAALVMLTLTLSGLIVLRLAASIEASTERQMDGGAHEIAFAVDREIAATINALVALEGSPLLRSGNLEAFYQQAAELAQRIGTQLVLYDVPHNEQVINTAFAWGTTLPRGTPIGIGDAERTVLKAGKPMVSDVFLGPLVRRHLVAVGVPVLEDANTRFVLFALLRVDQFEGILKQSRLEDQWIVTIVDRKGAIVARSKEHDKFAGKPTGPPALDAAVQSGIRNGQNREGVQFVWAYRRSEMTGWVAAVGVPQGVLKDPFRIAIGGLILIGMIAVLAAGIVAYRASGSFARAIGELREAVAAARVGRGSVPRDVARGASDDVSGILSAATAELLAAEDRRNFALAAAEVGTWQWDLTTGQQVWSDRCREIMGVSHEVESNRGNFLDRVHPADRRMVENTMASSLAAGDRYELEYRIIRADTGAERWVRAMARVDRGPTDRPLRVVGVNTDVTVRKRAEQEIRESAAQLKTLVETVADGVVLIDARGHVLLFNPACEKLFRYCAEEILGRNVKIF